MLISKVILKKEIYIILIYFQVKILWKTTIIILSNTAKDMLAAT